MAHRRSRQRLTERDLPLFEGEGLLDAVGRTLCEAGCVPRKELYESWAVARRVLRRMKGGPVLDLAGGHGLVAWLLLIQDRTTPHATVVDHRVPASAERIAAALGPRFGLEGRVRYVEGDLAREPVGADTRVLGVHACGGLTDRVLDIALEARARVAVLPCCHATAKLDDGDLAGWMDAALAIDATRAGRVRAAGYRVWTTTIPEDITPMNRLLLGVP